MSRFSLIRQILPGRAACGVFVFVQLAVCTLVTAMAVPLPAMAGAQEPRITAKVDDSVRIALEGMCLGWLGRNSTRVRLRQGRN